MLEELYWIKKRHNHFVIYFDKSSGEIWVDEYTNCNSWTIYNDDDIESLNPDAFIAMVADYNKKSKCKARKYEREYEFLTCPDLYEDNDNDYDDYCHKAAYWNDIADFSEDAINEAINDYIDWCKN